MKRTLEESPKKSSKDSTAINGGKTRLPQASIKSWGHWRFQAAPPKRRPPGGSLQLSCSSLELRRCRLHLWDQLFNQKSTLSGFETLFVIRNEDDLEGKGDSARRLKIMCICNIYIYIYIYRPWKSKIKQRMVFRMIHVKDSLLPMGKISLVYIYIYIYTHRVSNNLYTQYITISSRV